MNDVRGTRNADALHHRAADLASPCWPWAARAAACWPTGSSSLPRSQGWHAQSTSVPGVAQRTGATIYYVEMLPPTGGHAPVLSLMPAQGDVDVVIAAELMEAGPLDPARPGHPGPHDADRLVAPPLRRSPRRRSRATPSPIRQW